MGAVSKYLDAHGLDTLIREIRRNTAKVYKAKGTAIYADANYLAHVQNQDAGYHADITSAGLWQLIDGTWTKIEVFEIGWVYNIENRFTTTSDFVEGVGILEEPGCNICVAEIVSGTPATYKWDLLGKTVDLSDYQGKRLITPLTLFTNTTPNTYSASSLLPASETASIATITNNMIAIISGGNEAGDVYRAHVAENAIDASLHDITWTKLGNQNTVEGSLELLSNICPNTTITDAEIIAMFNS